MIHTENLTGEQSATLQRLLNSPMAQQATEAHEADRAAQRAALIRKADADRTAALAAAAEAGRARRAAEVECAAAAAALATARCTLHAADYWSMVRGEAIERIDNRLTHDLAPLGNAAIAATLHRLAFELRQAFGAVLYQPNPGRDRAEARIVSVDRHGTRTFEILAPTAIDAALPPKIERLQSLAAELEALRTAGTSPREIEARCAEVDAWLLAGAIVPRTPSPSQWAKNFYDVRRMLTGSKAG